MGDDSFGLKNGLKVETICLIRLYIHDITNLVKCLGRVQRLSTLPAPFDMAVREKCKKTVLLAVVSLLADSTIV